MKERLKKYAPWVVYPLFYVLCLAVFAVLTFPFDKLRERIVTSFNSAQRASNGTQELQIDGMSSYWISGVKMTGVKLLSAPSEPGKPPSEIKIDEARVRFSILSALIGNQDMSFNVDAFGGQVTGSYGVHGKDKSVDVDIDGVDLSQVDAIAQAIGIPVEGRITGNVKIAMPEGKASKASGTIALEAKDVTVGDGKAKVMKAFALPKMNVGALTLSGEAKDGVLKISKLAAGGKDIELQGEGRVQMRELATESLLDVNARFKINDGYRTKNDITKSLFGAPGSTAPALIDVDPRVKSSKRSDGFYGWAIRGQLGKPDFVPSAGGSGGVLTPATPASPAPGSLNGPALRKVLP